MIKDLPIIGSIYVSCILSGMLINSNIQNNKKLDYMQQAIEIIQEQDEEITSLHEALISMNTDKDELTTKINQMSSLDTILKDLASSWTKK